MLHTLKVMRVSYPDIRIPQWQGRRLRGFFGAEQENTLLHNHFPDSRTVYRYPLVQYKVLGGVPTIVAIEEGISAVYPLVMERETLLLGEREYPRGNLRFDLRKERMGDCAGPRQYRFVSPWFALNQDNFRAYQTADGEERAALLNRILLGNILSMAKGLGVTVEEKLELHAELHSGTVPFKGETMRVFWGGFTVNYILPDLFGLGKSISRGFGAIRSESGVNGDGSR